MDDAWGARQTATGRSGFDDQQWLQVSLAKAQLLSVRFAQDIYTRAVSGTHWTSTDGIDFSIGPGERVKLSAGLALIDGEGTLQLSPVDAPVERHANLRSWRLVNLFKRRALALQIYIN
jgi:hypothetical protein